MPINHVIIYYGPCDSFDTVAHKPQKLKGLRERLHKLGFRVDLVPVEFRNYCIIEICNNEIFRCNLQNLKFNTSYLRDPVCQRAINAVLDSSAKFQRARYFLWVWNLIEEQILKRNEYGPKDYWPAEIDIKPYASCLECLQCCGGLVSLKN